jgi:hypothetical protein
VNTGSTLQFGSVGVGFIDVKEGTMQVVPHIRVVSKRLDLMNAADMKIATKGMYAMMKICGTPVVTGERYVVAISESPLQSQASNVWFKRVWGEWVGWKGAEFSAHADVEEAKDEKPGVAVARTHASTHLSLWRMMACLERLHMSEDARDYIVFPLGFVELSDDYYIFFPRLGEDWRIGMPDDQKECEKVAAAMQTAQEAINRTNVVHMDLYLSNIMWRWSSNVGVVEIKVVDWDTCCFKGTPLAESVVAALKSSPRAHLVESENASAHAAHDTFYMDVLAANSANQSLKSKDANALNKAFKQLSFDFQRQHSEMEALSNATAQLAVLNQPR